MGTIIKKNVGFLYWVLLPSLLLMASVFGVNLISRPAASLYGSIFCQNDDECNSARNNCVVEFCNSNNTLGVSFCDIDFYDSNEGGECSNCYVCGNGRCETAVSEDSMGCDQDCIKKNGDAIGTARFSDVCVNSAGVPNACGADLDTDDNPLPPNPPNLDGCCPAGCQGADPTDSLTFDEDCCDSCGDGFLNSLIENCGEPGAPTCGAAEFCSPASCRCLPTCRINGQLDDIDGNGTIDEACDPQAVPDGCATGEVCDQTCTCQPIPPACGDGTIDPGEECDPPNGTTCDAACQLIPQAVCGNGVVETGEQCDADTCTATINNEDFPGVCIACQCVPECQAEGSGCGDSGTDNPAVCFAGTGGTGGSSLIPVGVRTSVLAQWLAAFAIPGAAFVGLKVRRRLKK